MKDDIINKLHDQIEQEHHYSDGIYQIETGLAVTFFALFNLLGIGGFVLFILFFIYLIGKHLRKRFTFPRIGFAKLKDLSPTRVHVQRFIISVLFIGIFAYFMLTNTEVFPDNSSQLFFPVMLVLYILSFFWSQIDNKSRKQNLVYHLTWFVWGIAWLLWISPEKWQIRISIEAAYLILLVLGLFNLIYGVITLRSFIKQYPVLTDEER